MASLLALANRQGAPEALGTVAFIVFFLLHWGLYLLLATYQSHRVWQRQRIGIAIDGVLGDHRTRFASLLPAVAEGKTLDPESIAHIPLHECEVLRNATGEPVAVSERDEHAVFNATAYWTDVAAYKDAARVIRDLHDSYRFRIMIFTYRPWPKPAAYDGTMSTTQWTSRNPMTWGQRVPQHAAAALARGSGTGGLRFRAEAR